MLSRRLVPFVQTAVRRASDAWPAADAEYVDIVYTEEHRQLQETVQKVIDKDINPYVEEWEKKKMFPAKELFPKLGKVGILGIDHPTEYGGLGLNLSYNIAVAETLGNINCGGVPMAIGVQSSMATPALRWFGSEELKQEFLVPSISGEKVACLGVSEVTAGSDVASIGTTAVRQGDDLIINGGKMWTTNGAQADWMCLLANTSDPKTGIHNSKSLICVPMDLPGISRSQPIDKLGMHSSDTVQVFFEDVRVPAKNIIGEEGAGFTYQMLQFQNERLIGVASSLTPLDRLIDYTIEYAGQRKIFGGTVLSNQVVHYRLAELKTEIEALRSLLYRAVAKRMMGEDVTFLASMAKLKAGRLVREVADSCLQYWGGMGYTTECIASRFYRDLRLLSIGAGADEVMLAIICKYMGTLPKPTKK